MFVTAQYKQIDVFWKKKNVCFCVRKNMFSREIEIKSKTMLNAPNTRDLFSARISKSRS